MIITHLFSAPLTKKARPSSLTPEPVPELNHQIERDTLTKTLAESGKSIEFISEAANETSFAKAVGCPGPDGDGDGPRERRIGAGSRGRNPSQPWNARGGDGARNRRDGRNRILHFTGHGEEFKLTFEDKYGQLEYVLEHKLEAMLRCREPAEATAPLADQFSQATALGHGQPCCGYAPFEDASESMEEVSIEEVSFLERGGHPRDGTGGARSETGRKSRTGLQLVFISSCHSESLAPIFVKAVSAAGEG